MDEFFLLLAYADVLVAGVFMSPADVAVYFATVKTLALVHSIYFAVKADTKQRFARYAHGDQARLASLARNSLSWTFWSSLKLALIVLALGKPVLSLFDPEFTAGYLLLLHAASRRHGAGGGGAL